MNSGQRTKCMFQGSKLFIGGHTVVTKHIWELSSQPWGFFWNLIQQRQMEMARLEGLHIITLTLSFWALLLQGQFQTGVGAWVLSQSPPQVFHVTPSSCHFYFSLQKFMLGRSEGSQSECHFLIQKVCSRIKMKTQIVLILNPGSVCTVASCLPCLCLTASWGCGHLCVWA